MDINYDLTLPKLCLDLQLQLVEYLYKYYINTWIKLFQLADLNENRSKNLYSSYLYLLRKHRYILTKNEITKLNQYLIKLPVEVDGALNYATKFGYIHIIQYLVSKHPDLSALNLKIDYNPLFQWAAFNGRLEVLRYFLEKCPNVNIHVNNDYAFRITTEHSQPNINLELDECQRAKNCLKYLIKQISKVNVLTE